MKVIIAGSRDFDDYEALKAGIIESGFGITEIISGGARGADALGERYAEENSLALSIFPADWDKFGKSAGMIRNKEMADNADGLIAYWDGKSRGTKNMIDIANAKKLNVHICMFHKKQETTGLFEE